MRLQFGIFVFDASTRELWRDGVPVRLEPQPLLVLSLLLENAGKVITREQLRQAVWGTSTFVDFDRGLNYCVAQMRSALGDSATSPRFVRTIPKTGYQFVAQVTPATALNVPRDPAVPRRSYRKLALAALVLLLCAVPAGWVLARQPRPVIVAVARFDNQTGSAEMDSFSDGLTDTLVAELTDAGRRRYGIIGNAAVLRRPRETRDLAAIASSLHASYVVLGQVQRTGSRVRVLAHLIRLPEQTHLWVVRADRDVRDPLGAESELARLIATEFLPRLNASSSALTR